MKKHKEYFKKENDAMKKLSKEEIEKVHLISIKFGMTMHLRQEMEENDIEESKINNVANWFAELEHYTIYNEIKKFILAKDEDKWRHCSPRSYQIYIEVEKLHEQHKELNKKEWQLFNEFGEYKKKK